MATTTSNWCDLQLDLLELILKKLVVVDIARFKSVCCCWKRAADSYTSSPKYIPFPEAPWLMIPSPRDDKNADYFSFFSLSEKKLYYIKKSFQGFDCPGLKIAGSSHGWLAISNYNISAMVYLLNPISGSKIHLPSPWTLPYFSMLNKYCSQVVISSNPSRNKNFFVVMRYKTNDRFRLAFCKNGDKRWREICSHQSSLCITFHKGSLYALGVETLEGWDLEGNYPMKIMDFHHGLNLVDAVFRLTSVKMVESMGELYLLSTVSGFEILKLNFTAKEWEKVEDLDEDQAIFHDGATGMMLLSTRDLPQLTGNSMYFTDTRHYSILGYEVMRGLVYSFEKKEVTEEYCKYPSNYRNQNSTVWIVPNPW